MMDKINKKIITVSYVIAGFLAAIVVQVLLKTLAASWGLFAKYYTLDFVQHGVPVLIGLGTFFFLQFNKKIVIWSDEVIIELKKVVWPTKKDTIAMTIVSCVMVIIACFVLGTFDFLSSNLVNLIVK